MTRAEIVAEVGAVESGLDTEEQRGIWRAALFGWRPPEHLAVRVQRLRLLRDRVGRDAAARDREARA